VDRAQHALREAERPFDSLAAFVKLLEIRRGGDFSNSSDNPSLMVSCDLPLYLDSFDYDKPRKGYRAVVRCDPQLHRGQGCAIVLVGMRATFALWA
jgi:hypothetical protein